MSRLNAGLVVQYAFRRIVDRFIDPDEAARERPLTSEWILLSFDKKRCGTALARSEEHTSELQSLMRISYAVICLKKKIDNTEKADNRNTNDKEQQQKKY